MLYCIKPQARASLLHPAVRMDRRAETWRRRVCTWRYIARTKCEGVGLGPDPMSLQPKPSHHKQCSGPLTDHCLHMNNMYEVKVGKNDEKSLSLSCKFATFR